MTLVNIYTLVPAGREREAIGTRALETSGIVGALAIGADTRALQTLIDIPAVSGCDVKFVPWRTVAVETAGCVDTLSEAGAGTEAGALVPVHTLVAVLVKLVSDLALAPEAAHGVHAGPVLADARHHPTLVNLLQVSRHGVHDLTWTSATTEVSVGGRVLGWTPVTLLAPALTHGAAANHLGLRLGHGLGADPGLGDGHEALLLPHVDTLVPVW